MPDSKHLEMGALLAPIPGGNPEGSRVSHTLRQKLEACRKEFEPNPEGANLPPIPKKADWLSVIKITQETLQQTSKDLEIALRMVEGLTRQYGLSGLTEGFQFLREMTRECWDRMHPIPDVEDGEGMEIRAERFNWIGDAESGARFPFSVRSIPVVKAGGLPLSVVDVGEIQRGTGPIEESELAKAVLLSPDLVQGIEDCKNAFMALEESLTERLGNQAPAFVGLRAALGDLGDLVRRYTPKDAPADTSASASDASQDHGTHQDTGMVNVAVNQSAIRSRSDIYAQVLNLANTLEKLEPHSPIPYLLRRAVELGKMPFSRLIQELVRDPSGLSEIRREFGLPAEENVAPSEI